MKLADAPPHFQEARVGVALTIPKGTPIQTTAPGANEYPAGRSYDIIPHVVSRHNNTVEEIVWVGTAGYWRRVRIEP